MRRNGLLALAAGTFVAAGLAFMAPGAAQATDNDGHQGHKICPTWSLRSIVGAEWQESPAEGSKVYDAHTVALTKPEGGGTEFAAFDVGFESKKPVSITVDYELKGGADYAAGAVRMFYYEAAGADTLADVPTAAVAADAAEGTLTIPDVTKIGTLGLVYDASNSAGGKVVFSNLRIGYKKVKFKGVCETKSPSPSPSSPTPSESTSQPPTSTSSAPGGGGGALPVTGAGVAGLSVAGAVLVGAGVLFMTAGRRRRRFEA
jgi:hypothetical protein